MKKHTLILALILMTGTAAYSMESTDKQSCTNAPEAASVTPENMNLNASDELLTLLATDNKQSEVVKWVGQHKKLIATLAALSAVYCARNVPFLPELDSDNGSRVQGNNLPKIGLNRFLRIKWAHASNKEKTAATLLAITAALLTYDLAQGKDAKLVNLINKFETLSTQEKSKLIRTTTCTAVGTSAGLLLIASILSFLKYKIDPDLGYIANADRSPRKLSPFQRKVQITGLFATRAQKPLAILMAATLVAGIMSYEYMQGKDSMAYKLWNKILSTIKSSTNNSQQPATAPVTA